MWRNYAVKAKKYTVTKSLRFTPEEWARVVAELRGRKWSAAVRALLLHAELPQPTVRVRCVMSAKDANKIMLLAGLANNLNQLARAANTAALNGQRVDVLMALMKIERGVQGLYDL